MGDENSKNPNTQGNKVYRDSIIKKISDEDPNTVFTSENESNANKAVDDVAKDESFVEVVKGKTAPQLKAGSPDIEKFPEGQRHSFEHGVEPSSVVTGQESSGLPKVAKTDPVADKNKDTY